MRTPISEALKLEEWLVYDAKSGILHPMNNERFRVTLLDLPVKLKGDYMDIEGRKVWVDAILNSEHL